MELVCFGNCLNWILTGRCWWSFLWITDSEQTTSSSIIVIFVVYTFQQCLGVRVFCCIILKITKTNWKQYLIMLYKLKLKCVKCNGTCSENDLLWWRRNHVQPTVQIIKKKKKNKYELLKPITKSVIKHLNSGISVARSDFFSFLYLYRSLSTHNIVISM